MICSLCLENKNLVYFDYCKKFSLSLCFGCLGVLGWNKEINKILPKIVSCSTCKQKFIPKRSNQIKCSVCWSSNYPQTQKKSFENSNLNNYSGGLI